MTRWPFPRVLMSAAVFALVASPARANDGMPPKIYELFQEGQDVVYTFGILEPGGEPDVDELFTLTRSGPEGEVKIFELRELDTADAEARDPHCYIHDESLDQEDADAYCAEHETECADCDGDGSFECPTEESDFGAYSISCSAYLTYTVVDACVPPGTTWYQLEYQQFSGGPFYNAKSDNIDVIDSGEACEGGDGYGCSVSGLGRRDNGSIALALFMGLLGVLAVCTRRTIR